MEKRKQSHRAQANVHVDRMRRLYSQIGEPLPADVIIDLSRNLGAALELLSDRRRPTIKTKLKKRRLN